MRVNVVDVNRKQIYGAVLSVEGEECPSGTRSWEGGSAALRFSGQEENPEYPYLSPGWIDCHCHIYHGTTSFGLLPDRIGHREGVHMLVDAGSSGAETFRGFTDYVILACQTEVRAFLNISSIGLVTMQEYYDIRKVSAEEASACINSRRDVYLGVKVRSSGLIVEDKGTIPIKQARKAADMVRLPLMVHMGETPPSNEDNLMYVARGDIISHCFHGKASPLWTKEGEPVSALKNAIDRGAILDIAHGAASFNQFVAGRAIANGYRNFIISTDLHGRSIAGPVYSLSHTMSKLYSLGLCVLEVIQGVTSTPARAIGLHDWCSDIGRNATLFYIRPRNPGDKPFLDSDCNCMDVPDVIEPIANIINGRYAAIDRRRV